jgi:hypothetical protein
MKQREIKFLSDVKSFDQKLMKEIQAFLLPAFKGMRFGSPSCDSDDDGFVYISGTVFDKDDVSYTYSIALYPSDDKVRIDIDRHHHGSNLTRLTNNEFWTIEGVDLTAKEIAEKKRLLDAKLPNK